MKWLKKKIEESNKRQENNPNEYKVMWSLGSFLSFYFIVCIPFIIGLVYWIVEGYWMLFAFCGVWTLLVHLWQFNSLR